jgi:hypothetical protein
MRENLISECNAVYAAEGKKRSRVWSVLTAFFTFITPSRLFYRSKKKAKDRLNRTKMICSSNALLRLKSASTMKNLSAKERDAYFPEIRSKSSPKALEDELRKKDYKVGVYTATEGKGGPYQVIKAELKKQIDRLYVKETGDESLNEPLASGEESISQRQRREYREQHPHRKSSECHRQYEELTNAVEKSNLNELAKALYILKHMTEYLKFNTGFGLRRAKSYSSVMDVAAEIGIHEEDVRSFHERLDQSNAVASHNSQLTQRKVFASQLPQPHRPGEEGSEGEGIQDRAAKFRPSKRSSSH